MVKRGHTPEYKIEYLNWLAVLSCLDEFDWPFVYLNVSCLIDILVGHLREMHEKWPVATCYFVL